jgi:hypothetical protein
VLDMGFRLAKKSFLTVEAVQKQLDRTAARILMRTGGYARTVARRSMRRRKAASGPGEPPSAHAGQLRDLLFFAWDSGRRSVVVGPVPFGGAKSAGLRPRVPELMESGGTVATTDRRGRRRTAQYQARPYMQPAFEATLARGITEGLRGATGLVGG